MAISFSARLDIVGDGPAGMNHNVSSKRCEGLLCGVIPEQAVIAVGSGQSLNYAHPCAPATMSVRI